MKRQKKGSIFGSFSSNIVLTKWMLVIFSLGTLGYYILLGIKNEAPPESFFMNFVFGLGEIGGAFTIGNIFDHRTKAEQVKSKAGLEKDQAEE